MRPQIAPSLILLLLAKFSTSTNAASDGTCTLACNIHEPEFGDEGKGTCTKGPKNYAEALGASLDHILMPTEANGMHCICPDEKSASSGANKLTGVSGPHCGSSFERCPDNSICFNGGYCQSDSHDRSKWHCACPEDLRYNGFEKYGDGYDAHHGTSNVWTGLYCEVPASDFCSEQDHYYDLTGGRWFCSNGGVCVDNEDNLANKCDCPAGYFGMHCEYKEEAAEKEVPKCDLECKNGGGCETGAKSWEKVEPFKKLMEEGFNITEILGSNIRGQHCVCPKGFTGLQCEKDSEDFERYSKCGDGVCFNDATCVEETSIDGKKVYDYHCSCKTSKVGSFAGEYCQHESTTYCPAPKGHDASKYYCVNGGKCPLKVHDACTGCNDGYTGPRCETKIEVSKDEDEEETCDLVCQNGGECFFGDSPVVDKTILKLQGLQQLMDNKHCRCQEGFIGLRCEMRFERCQEGEHYCLHGSGCVSDNDEFTCDCKEASTALVSYAGHYCEHAATEFCTEPGEQGSHSFCTNHGQCKGTVGKDEDHIGCDCEEGWLGDYCEFDRNDYRTGGVATKIFFSFILVVTFSVLVFCISIKCRKRQANHSYYESAAGPQEVALSPYGDDHSSSSDESDDDYEMKEVTII